MSGRWHPVKLPEAVKLPFCTTETSDVETSDVEGCPEEPSFSPAEAGLAPSPDRGEWLEALAQALDAPRVLPVPLRCAVFSCFRLLALTLLYVTLLIAVCCI